MPRPVRAGCFPKRLRRHGPAGADVSGRTIQGADFKSEADDDATRDDDLGAMDDPMVEEPGPTAMKGSRRRCRLWKRDTTLTMIFKLRQVAEKRWKKIKGFRRLAEVITGVVFRNGIKVSDQLDRMAA